MRYEEKKDERREARDERKGWKDVSTPEPKKMYLYGKFSMV